MKKTAISLCLAGVSILTVVGCGTHSSSNTNTAANKTDTTNPSKTIPTSVPFTPQSITFMNSDVGYVSGQTQSENGTSVGYVYKTTDSGHTWHKILQKGTGVSNVAVFGRDVWVDVIDHQKGKLYFSTDEGHIFKPINQLALENIDFTSRNNGWAITQGNSLRTNLKQTKDGGRTWMNVNMNHSQAGLGPTGNPTWISFVDAKNGLLLNTSEPGAGSQGKALLRTTNSGRTWNVISDVQIGTKSKGNELGSGGYADGIDVIPSHPSYAYIWESRGFLLYSSDSGKSWHASAVTKPALIEAHGVSMQSVKDGFVLLQDMDHRDFVIEHTTNGGDSWDVVYKWSYS